MVLRCCYKFHNSCYRENDVCRMIESTSLNSHHSSLSTSHGGGPMVNAMNLNGRLSTVTTPDNSNALTLNNNTEYSAMSDLSVHDFEFFPSSNYEMEDRPWTDRPESRHSMTSAPSPMNPFSNASPAPNPPSTPFSSSLPFSPLDSEMKDSKDQIMMDNNENCESARLRNLLTNKKAENEDNRKQIMENFLSNEGGMEVDGDAGPSLAQRKVMTPSSMNSDSSSYNKSGSNMMLLKVSYSV